MNHRTIRLTLGMLIGCLSASAVYGMHKPAQRPNQPTSSSISTFFKPVAREVASLATEALVNPLAIGFISHKLLGNDFYKAAGAHFLIRPRLQNIFGAQNGESLYAAEEALRYGIGAAASSMGKSELLALYVAYHILSKVVRAGSHYVVSYFKDDKKDSAKDDKKDPKDSVNIGGRIELQQKLIAGINARPNNLRSAQ